MEHRESQREVQRTAVEAEEPSSSDLFLVYGFDVWRNEEYTVAWIDPAGNSKTVLPPGMTRLPRPGEAFVSPALDRLASQEPDLAARYPNRSVLGVEGVRSGGELFAYVRIREDRSFTGVELAERASRFGPLPSSEGRYSNAEPFTFSNLGTIAPRTFVSLTAYLIIPGLVVLIAGIVTLLGFRNESSRVSHLNVASNREPIVLRVLGTSLLALPSLVLATVIWGLASPRLNRVPLVGHGVVRGDLQIPWWILLTELAVATTLTGFFALVAIKVSQIQRSLVSTRILRRFYGAANSLYQTQFGVALLALLLGYSVLGPNLMLVFATGLTMSVPLLLTSIFRMVDSRIDRLGSESAWSAGRIVEYSSSRAMRPFLGIATLVCLAITCAGYVALAQHIDEPLPTSAGEAQVVFVNWVSPSQDDARRLAEALDQELVVAFREASQADGTHTLLVGGNCRQFAAYFPNITCEAGAPFKLTNKARRELANMLVPATESFDTEIRLAPIEKVGASDNLVVIDDVPLKILESRVRTEAMQVLSAPSFYSLLTNVMYPTPTLAWMVGGSTIIIVALAITCFMSLVNRFSNVYERDILDVNNLHKRSTWISVCQFIVLFSIAAVVGCIAGFASCALLVSNSGLAMPWQSISIVLLVTVVKGIAGTLSVAALGTGSNPEGAVE